MKNFKSALKVLLAVALFGGVLLCETKEVKADSNYFMNQASEKVGGDFFMLPSSKNPSGYLS